MTIKEIKTQPNDINISQIIKDWSYLCILDEWENELWRFKRYFRKDANKCQVKVINWQQADKLINELNLHLEQQFEGRYFWTRDEIFKKWK